MCTPVLTWHSMHCHIGQVTGHETAPSRGAQHLALLLIEAIEEADLGIVPKVADRLQLLLFREVVRKLELRANLDAHDTHPIRVEGRGYQQQRQWYSGLSGKFITAKLLYHHTTC